MIPEQVKTSMNEDVNYIYNHLLALPCDHRYQEEEMRIVGRTLQEYSKITELI